MSTSNSFLGGLEGFLGQPRGPNFPSPWVTMLALRPDCSTPQMVLSIRELVELKMLDFRDRTRTGISILTSAADKWQFLFNINLMEFSRIDGLENKI